MCHVVIEVFGFLVSNILYSSGPENENSSRYFSGPIGFTMQSDGFFCCNAIYTTTYYHPFSVRCLVGQYMFTYLLQPSTHPHPPPGPSFHILYLSSLVPHPSPFTPHHSYLLLTQSNIYIFVNYCRSLYCENYTLSRYGPIDWLIIMLIKTFHAVHISIDSTQPCGPFLLVIFQEQFVKNVACKTSEKLWQSIKIFYSKPSGKNA